MAEGRDQGDVWARSERVLGGPSPRDRDPRATLLALAERAPSVDEIDHYGEGGNRPAPRSTGRRAARKGGRRLDALGHDGASDRASRPCGAPRQHAGCVPSRSATLDEHEQLAYEMLHGLEAQLLGSRDRPHGDLRYRRAGGARRGRAARAARARARRAASGLGRPRCQLRQDPCERGRRASRRRAAVAVRAVLRSWPRRDRRLSSTPSTSRSTRTSPPRPEPRWPGRPTSSRRRASGRCATAVASTASIPT